MKSTLATLTNFIELFHETFFKKEPLPKMLLILENIRINTMAEYRKTKTVYGLSHQIVFNLKHLNDPPCQQLATILHQMTHCWEVCYHHHPVNYWYHTMRFRQQMVRFGIICDLQGNHLSFKPKSDFVTLLKEHDIPISLSRSTRKGHSKLQKWSCDCTNVRVAVASFQAICLNCNKKFQCQDAFTQPIGAKASMNQEV